MCLSFDTAPFLFYLLTESDKLSARKDVFLLQKEKLKYALYSSGKQRLQSYSVSDKVNIPVHWTLYTIIPVFPNYQKWKDGDLYWMIDSTEIY